MEFDKSKVYTAVNADELKVGSQVICADDLADLKIRVTTNNFESTRLVCINDESCLHRFITSEDRYVLAYLVSEPEEKKLKWTDLKVGDIITNGEITAMVIVVDSRDGACHIFVGDFWITNDNLEKWEKVENDR
jgi:hypothetical protein